MSRYHFIQEQAVHYPVRLLCQALAVPPSRYYAWRQRPSPSPGADTPAWETALVETFTQHQRRYGTRRLRADLQAQGHRVGRGRLRAALQRLDLRALQPRRFSPRTTDSTHGLRCAPNRLLDQPRPTQANRVWVSDITYLPLAAGTWAYLCAFQEACTCRVVGWQVLDQMPETLVTTALQRALQAQQPGANLVVHSDRGGQYCGRAYRALLVRHHALRSHSRRGDCYDNAQAESLWSRLKTEELDRRAWPVFADLADAQTSVATYFDYYNHRRRHSAIGYLTPQSFHQQLLTKNPHLCPA